MGPASTILPPPGAATDSLARAAARLGLPEPVHSRPAEAAGWPELSVPALQGTDGEPASAERGRERALGAAVVVAGRVTGVADERLLATWVSGWFVHWAVGPALLAWLDDHRVAALEPTDVAVWWDGEGPVHVCSGVGRWGVLPDDPLAGSGTVDVATDEDALDALLHERITSLLTPVFEAFRSGARVGMRQQWLQAADRMALILQDAGAEVGQEAAAITAAERLLGRPRSPFVSARGRFLPLATGVPGPRVYQRATCCLAFRAPGGETCPTCPARPASSA